ncbi:MAG TPA: DUF3142 domain-containing protein [Bryobacteraceae bacterium]
MRRRALVAAVGIGLVAIAAASISRPAKLPSSFPDVILWAWEERQDLRFIQPGMVGIAFLERTVWLLPQRVRSLPRTQPLIYTPGTPLIATVRLEIPRRSNEPLPPAREAALAVAEAATGRSLRSLQVDFDARMSDRAWYIQFLRELRREVPQSLPITITALESWCEEDRPWFAQMAIADATPMMFRMGPDENRTPTTFPASICNASAGVSTDEMPERIPHGARRIYIFHPAPWTKSAYDLAMERVRVWRSQQ